MSIPAWVQRLLDEQNPDGITRRIRARRCGKCHAITLRGLDDDTAALTAIVDPEPITAGGELAALLTGRPTYRLSQDGDRWQLDRRDRWRIRGVSADHADVLAAHRCHTPLPARPTTPTPTRPQEAMCPPY